MGIRIGVDGGGSKTEIVAVDLSGQVFRRQRQPSSNYQVAGMELAVRHILAGIRGALQGQTPESIGITLAGIDTAEDWKVMAGGLEQGLADLGHELGMSFLEIPVVIENDALGALMSVQGEFRGNVLVAGTGAIALGVNAAGEIIRVGGWGHLIGDEGSGYDIGRKALAAAVASFDGYGPQSLLEVKIPEYLGLAKVLDVSGWLYQHKSTTKEVAALVPVVIQAAWVGDPVAKEILAESGSALGRLTRALLRQTKVLDIGLVGGLEQIWEWLEPTFRETVGEEFSDMHILKPKYSPSVGAALLSGVKQARRLPRSR
ncbi:MAG: BadF/BadG/BcrA/BcrD ATPase family protein [Desulfitobacteriaceae bacterium]